MNSINNENIAIAINTVSNGTPKKSTPLSMFMIETIISRKNSNIIFYYLFKYNFMTTSVKPNVIINIISDISKNICRNPKVSRKPPNIT